MKKYSKEWATCYIVLVKEGLWKDEYYKYNLKELRKELRRVIGTDDKGISLQLNFLDVLDASLEE